MAVCRKHSELATGKVVSIETIIFSPNPFEYSPRCYCGDQVPNQLAHGLSDPSNPLYHTSSQRRNQSLCLWEGTLI